MAAVMIKVSPDVRGEPQVWEQYDCECVGPCPTPLECLEYDTGFSVEDEGVEHYLFECCCGELDEFGVVHIVQKDDWSEYPLIAPTPCRSFAMQSSASGTARYEGLLCVAYDCPNPCEIQEMGEYTHFDVDVEDEEGMTWVMEGRFDNCTCP